MVIDLVCSIVFEAEGEEADAVTVSSLLAALHRRLCAMEPVAGVFVLVLITGLFVGLAPQPAGPDVRSWAFAAGCDHSRLCRRQPVAWRVHFCRVHTSQCGPVVVVAAIAAILTGVTPFPPARELFRFGPLHGDDILVTLASGLIACLLLSSQRDWCSHCPMCIIGEPELSNDQPTEIQRDPYDLIDYSCFLGRTRVAHFSTEIATSMEVSP
jgi:Ca2+-transporting ATPase